MLRDLLDGVPESSSNIEDALLVSPKEYEFLWVAAGLWPLLADLQEAAQRYRDVVKAKSTGWVDAGERLDDALAALRIAIEEATPPETAEPASD